MKTRILMLMAVLLLVPFVAANAAPFTIHGMKKVTEVWLNHGGVDGGGFDIMDSNWSQDQFLEGSKLFKGSPLLSGKKNQWSKSLTIDCEGDSLIYFVTLKNGNPKKFGMFDGQNVTFLKRKHLRAHILNWTKPVDKKEDGSGEPILVPVSQPVASTEEEKENPVVAENDEANGEADDNNLFAGLGEQILENAVEEVIADPVGAQPRNDGPAPVPEPATMLLLGSGLIGLAGAARRKVKKSQK